VWLTRTVWAAPWIAALALLAAAGLAWRVVTARRRGRRRLANAVARELAARDRAAGTVAADDGGGP
jgi:hypothetical protein